MRFSFTKMHGLGNDYVYVDCFKEKIDDPSKVAVFVSDRHFGIGSDGMILIKPSDMADCEMEMYNADGSKGEMCGNGIRCVAKFVYDKGICKKDELRIATGAGIKTLKLKIENDRASLITVDMGVPELICKKIPADFSKEKMINETIEVNGNKYQATAVSMGNPHCCIFLDENIMDLDLEKIGPHFENQKLFPNRVNTEFLNVIDRSHINMRVWERGSGETLACGTGACASAVAAVLNGFCDNDIDIKLLGGHLNIHYNPDEKRVLMTGPATIVYEGIIDIPSTF